MPQAVSSWGRFLAGHQRVCSLRLDRLLLLGLGVWPNKDAIVKTVRISHSATLPHACTKGVTATPQKAKMNFKLLTEATKPTKTSHSPFVAFSSTTNPFILRHSTQSYHTRYLIIQSRWLTEYEHDVGTTGR